MKYVLLLMANTEQTDSETELPGIDAYIAFDKELEEAGVLAGGFGLTEPEEATSVSRANADAEPVVTAGPYAESREYVGGTIVLDVKDLDEAIYWAGRCPAAIGGRVEIRPMLDL